jgi:hypothetical protein
MLLRVDVNRQATLSADGQGKQAGKTSERKALYVGAHARRIALA